MEVVNPNYVLLSNLEVLTVLRNINDTRKKFGLRNLATISYETIRFLEDLPCKTQTKDGIQGFLNDIKPYNITKNESLMLVNDPPTSALHIQLTIEDSEERLTDEQINEMINLSKKWLLPPEEE